LDETESKLTGIDPRASSSETQESFIFSSLSVCCSGPGHQSSGLSSVPYANILWAELGNDILTLTHTQEVSKNAIEPKVRQFTLTKSSTSEAAPFVASLLQRSYARSQQQRKRIKVLINPFGGQGKAVKLYHQHVAPIFEAARCTVSVETTLHHNHATEIAAALDEDAWDVVACASGDGLPYEVFNGLAKKPYPRRALRKVAVTQIPCGTGNGMSYNLYGTGSPSRAALAIVKGVRTPLDLVSITQGDRRVLSFLSQAFGIIAECDLGTENMRWMGPARFDVGFALRLLRKTVWPADVAIGIETEDSNDIKQRYKAYSERVLSSTLPDTSPTKAEAEDPSLPPLRFGTVNDPLPQEWKLTPYLNLGNFYAGNMAIMSPDANVFNAALPNDGLMDMINIDGDIARTRALELAQMVGKGSLIDQPDVRYMKVTGYRVIPHQKEGYISIDGERIPFEPYQAEVHSGLGTVISTGPTYEAEGPIRS
jgi:sphingosine kinase